MAFWDPDLNTLLIVFAIGWIVNHERISAKFMQRVKDFMEGGK